MLKPWANSAAAPGLMLLSMARQTAWRGHVGHQDGDDVGALRGLAGGSYLDAVASACFQLGPPGRRPDGDIEAAVAEVQRVGASLAAVADHRDPLHARVARLDIRLVIDLHAHSLFLRL
jgi:hypothetical protein